MAIEIRQPATIGDVGGYWQNEAQCHDNPTEGGDETTHSDCPNGLVDGTYVNFLEASAFPTAGQTYTALKVYAKWRTNDDGSGDDDTWGIEVSLDGSTWGNWMLAKALNRNTSIQKEEYTLATDQDLTLLRVRINATKSKGSDNDTLEIYDIWTEGVYTVAQTITLTSAISVAATVQSPTVARTNQYILPSSVSVAATVQAPIVAGSGSAPVTPSPVQVSATVQAPTVAKTNQYILPSPVVVSATVQAPTVAGSGSAPITIAAGIQVVASVQSPTVSVGVGWLSGWSNRVKLTIDSGDIDAALANFPILLYISALSGRNNDDISFVFDELIADSNRKKIAVTKDDGVTECYVEIERWDDGNEKAWLWVKVPSIASGTDTDLYLYYDVTHAENTTYVDDINTGNSHNVWDGDFVFVCHMRDDPGGDVDDSTNYSNDGTKKGYDEPSQAAAKIDWGQEFDGHDDKISCGTHSSLDCLSEITIETWINVAATASARGIVAKKTSGEWAENKGYSFSVTAEGCLLWMVGDTQTICDDVIDDSTDYYLSAHWTNEANSQFFIDNVEANYTTQNAPANPTASADQLRIGEYYDIRDIEGIIDEVRVSKVNRPASWRKASYESGRDDLLDWGSEEYTALITLTAAIAVSATVQAPTVAGTGSAPITLTAAIQTVATVQSPTVVKTNQYVLPSPVAVITSVQAPTVVATGSAPITVTPIAVIATVQAPTVSTPQPQTITLTAAISAATSVVNPSVAGTGSAPVTPTPIQSVASVISPAAVHTNQYILPSPVQVVASVQSPSVVATGSAPITLAAGIAVSATVQSPSVAGSGSAPITVTPIAVVRSVQAPTVVKTGQYILPSPVQTTATVQAPSIAGSGSAPVTVTPISVVATVQAPTVSTPSADQYIILTAAISVVTSVVTPSVSGSGSVPITLTPIAVVSSVQSPSVGATGSAPIGILPIAVIASVQSPTVAGTGSVAITLLPISVITSIVSPTVSITGDQVITILSAIATSATVVTPRVRLTAFILINAFLGNRVISSYITDLLIKGYIDERDFDTCIGDRSIDAYISDRGFDTSKRTKP